MLVAVAILLLQAAAPPSATAIVPRPPQATITGPSGRPSASPASNEVVAVGDLRISNGHLLTFGPGIAARAGFVIANAGDEPDRLLRASSPAATRVRLTRFALGVGEEDVETIDIAPHSAFTSDNIRMDHNRGRLQMRLEGLRLPADPSNGVPIVLHFERAGPVTVRVFPFIPNP